MGIENRLTEDMKKAMKEGDRHRLSVIRMARSAVKNRAIEKQGDLTEEDLIEVISREVKRCRESLEEYKSFGRTEDAERTKKEIEILSEYLPEQLDRDELEAMIRETIEEVGARDMRDMGKVMGAIMSRVKGRADGSEVNSMVKEILDRM